MLRKLVILAIIIWIPMLVPAQQPAQDGPTARLDVRLAADNEYEGRLTITYPASVASPAANTLALPMCIGKPEVTIGDADVSVVSLPCDPNVPLSLISIRNTDPSTPTIVIEFPIEPRAYSQEPGELPLRNTLRLVQAAYFIRDDTRQARGRHILHFRLAGGRSSVESEIGISAVSFSWEDGIAIDDLEIGSLDDDEVERLRALCGDCLSVPAEYFQERSSIEYFLPPPDPHTTLRISVFAAILISGSLMPVSLAFMSNLIQNQKQRIGIAVGFCILALAIATFLQHREILNIEDLIVAVVAGIVALLLIIVALVLSRSRVGAAAGEGLPDDLTGLPEPDLIQLRQKYRRQLAYWENQRADWGPLMVPYNIARNIEILEEYVHKLDGEIDRRLVPQS
jgi:hypothetical protein